jgi:hypothetical protein
MQGLQPCNGNGARDNASRKADATLTPARVRRAGSRAIAKTRAAPRA